MAPLSRAIAHSSPGNGAHEGGCHALGGGGALLTSTSAGDGKASGMQGTKPSGMPPAYASGMCVCVCVCVCVYTYV